MVNPLWSAALGLGLLIFLCFPNPANLYGVHNEEANNETMSRVIQQNTRIGGRGGRVPVSRV